MKVSIFYRRLLVTLLNDQDVDGACIKLKRSYLKLLTCLWKSRYQISPVGEAVC